MARFENKIIFYMIEKRISTKIYRLWIEHIREAKSSRKKKDKAVSFFKKMAKKKILEQSAEIRFQTDLRIADHRGHKLPPSLTLLSVQNSIRMASRLTIIAGFRAYFFQLLKYSS